MEEEILNENDCSPQQIADAEEAVADTEQSSALPVVEPEATEPEAESETETQSEADADPETPAAPDAEEPCEEADDLSLRRRVRRKRIFRGALRFYTLLLGGILCVLILLWCLMTPLQTLLTQYETAQPQYVAAEIYDTLFTDPDWALLYDMAGIQATKFEGRNAYVTYMEAKVGDTPLDYIEIPTGLSDEKRYSVRLEGEEVATFTMVPVDDGVSTFGRWTFGQVEVFFTRQEAATITIMPGYTVYINGVPLDDSYTTLRVDTLAEDYLPEGIHGYRYEQQHISGLLVQPDVIVLDEYNNPVAVTQDPETGVYSVPILGSVDNTWGERELILETVQAQALFTIQAISSSQLREYFSPSSQAYKVITGGELVSTKYVSYAFDESATVITDFYRYSDNLFSVWAQVKVDMTNKKGKVTSCTVGGTFFFSTGTLGDYTATELYDVDLQQLRFTELDSQP